MGGPGVKLFPFSQHHLSSPLLAPSPLWLNHNHHHPAVHRTPSSSAVFVNSRSWALVEKFASFSHFFVIPPVYLSLLGACYKQTPSRCLQRCVPIPLYTNRRRRHLKRVPFGRWELLGASHGIRRATVRFNWRNSN